MPNHTITNTTTSTLDMSPLCDLLGQRLTLRSQESRDVDDKTFNDDIIQRVIRARWLTVKPQSAHTDSEPVAPVELISPASEPPGPVVTQDEGDPASVPDAAIAPELAPTPVETEVPSASIEPEITPESLPEIPVEAPVISEKPLVEPVAPTSGKANKRR